MHNNNDNNKTRPSRKELALCLITDILFTIGMLLLGNYNNNGILNINFYSLLSAAIFGVCILQTVLSVISLAAASEDIDNVVYAFHLIIVSTAFFSGIFTVICGLMQICGNKILPQYVHPAPKFMKETLHYLEYAAVSAVNFFAVYGIKSRK